jgi:hypothetical protein
MRVQFQSLKVGDLFTVNGNVCMKTSIAMAQIIEYKVSVRIGKKEIVEVA